MDTLNNLGESAGTEINHSTIREFFPGQQWQPLEIYEKWSTGEEGPQASPLSDDEASIFSEFPEITQGEFDSDIEGDAKDNEGNGEPEESTFTKQGKSKLQVFNSNEVLNGYVIGEGGFGRVLRGDLHGTAVAIKLFHFAVPSTELHDKLQQLMELKHRNLVNILGVVKSDIKDCPQIVMDFICDGNLLQYLSRREPDFRMLGKLAYDVSDALDYLHTKRIVHGNLAARNILIENVACKYKVYHNAKLSDCGFVGFVEGSGGNYMKVHSGKVLPIRWVPKELVVEDNPQEELTWSTDAWSFGVVLWEMCTKGAIPYGASYSNLKVVQFLQEDYSPLKMHTPTNCPEPFLSAMTRLFSVNPDERPILRDVKDDFKGFRSYGLPNPHTLDLNSRYAGKPKTSDGATLPDQESEGDDSSQLNKPKKRRGGKKHRKRREAAAAKALEETVQRVEAANALPHEQVTNVSRSSRKEGTSPQGGAGSSSHYSNPPPRSQHHRGKGGKGKNLPPRFALPGQHPSYAGRDNNEPAYVVMPQAPPPYTPNPSYFNQPSSPVGAYGMEYVSRPFGRRGGMDGRPAPVPRRDTDDGTDYREKIKELERQIDQLKTEKITTDLLKNSSEFAAIMHQMTEQRLGVTAMLGRGASGVGPRRPNYNSGGYNDRYDRPPRYNPDSPGYSDPRSQGFERPDRLSGDKPYNNGRPQGRGFGNYGRGKRGGGGDPSFPGGFGGSHY